MSWRDLTLLARAGTPELGTGRPSPGERVDIAVRFPTHRGLFLMHCHNLEHEDAGMMLNFEVD